MREPGAEREVSPLELFFDLVYVFAIGELSHRHRLRDQLAIAHPGDDATLGFTLLAFGGPVLFLRGALGLVPCSRTRALAALAIPAVATAPLTLIAGIAVSSAVLVAAAVADTVREQGWRRSSRA